MATKLETNVDEIIKSINYHIRISRISYFVAIGFFFSWALSNLYDSIKWEIDERFYWVILIPILIIVLVNLLLLPVIIYYCLMIDRYLQILNTHYKIKIWLYRFVIYSPFFGLIVT